LYKKVAEPIEPTVLYDVKRNTKTQREIACGN